jgi:DnaJ family protein C protein 9
MPRRKQVQKEESEESSGEESQDLEVEEPPKIEPYAILGLEKTATADEVKKAYRKAALQHHPGIFSQSLSDQQF